MEYIWFGQVRSTSPAGTDPLPPADLGAYLAENSPINSCPRADRVGAPQSCPYPSHISNVASYPELQHGLGVEQEVDVVEEVPTPAPPSAAGWAAAKSKHMRYIRAL